MVALELLLTVAVVAVKVAEVAEAATVTDGGTVRVELVFDSETTAPPAGAPPLSVTVHVELLELLKLAGAQDKERTVGKAPPVTVPPVAESAMSNPAGDAAKLLLIGIEVEVRPSAMVRFTTATTPFEMIPEFMPDTIQVYVPAPGKQLKVLNALIDAVPAVAETETTLAGG